MDTMKDTTMQHVTDVTIVPEATAEFIAGLLARIEQLESDLATAEQDSRQKQARIERLEQAEKERCDATSQITQQLSRLADENVRLRARIEEMERQEPIGGMLEVSPHNYELRWYRSVPFGAKLYLAPGAKGE